MSMMVVHGCLYVRRCRDISVVGLWAGDMDPETSLKMLEAVRTKSGIHNLRVSGSCTSVLPPAEFGGLHL